MSRRLEGKEPDEERGCAYMDMAEDLVRRVVEGCWGWPEKARGRRRGLFGWWGAGEERRMVGACRATGVGLEGDGRGAGGYARGGERRRRMRGSIACLSLTLARACARAYTHTHARTRTHAYTNTHTHKHTHTPDMPITRVPITRMRTWADGTAPESRGKV